MVFILHQFIMDIHVSFFSDVRPSLHPRNKSQLIMVCGPFNVCFYSVASILLRLFALHLSEIMDYNFLVFLVVIVSFWYQDKVGLTKFIRMVFSLLIFWKNWGRIGIKSSLNVLQNSCLKLFHPGSFIWGNFLITALITMLIIGLFKFSLPSVYSCVILKILFIFSRLPDSLAYSCS